MSILFDRQRGEWSRVFQRSRQWFDAQRQVSEALVGESMGTVKVQSCYAEW